MKGVANLGNPMALEVEEISEIQEGHYGLYIFLRRLQEFVLCVLLVGGSINDIWHHI